MAFLSVGKEPKQQRLYLMEFTFPTGETYIKIGKSSGKCSTDRMLQVIRSYYMKFRTTPMVKILRDRECEDVFKLETALHHFFARNKAVLDFDFDGSTEFFDINPEVAKDIYKKLLDGEDLKDLPRYYKKTLCKEELLPTWAYTEEQMCEIAKNAEMMGDHCYYVYV